MTVLNFGIIEWLLVIEVVLLATAGMFRLAGTVIKPQEGDEDDPFAAFYNTFWKVFLRKRGKLRAAVTSLDAEKARQYQEMKQSGDVEGIRDLLSDEFGEHAFDETEITEALDASLAIPSIDDEPMLGGGGSGGGGAGGPVVGRPAAGTLTVKVIPFAATNELVSIRRDGVTIQVVSGPEEGLANKAVMELVAESLGVKPYQVTLLKGHYKPFKTLAIAGYNQSELDMKLSTFS